MSLVSPTVFKTKDINNKKYNYGTIDTRLVKCFNKLCKNTNTKVPKWFHYACYQHMIHTQVNDDMNYLEYEGVSDKILDQVVGVKNIKHVQEYLNNKENKLLFPVCGKRCFNIVNGTRNKSKPKGVSEYAATQNWDDDGTTANRSSIKVLLDWLTTEENASSYFGGVDAQGKTNGNRKESYHHYLRELIKKENGTFMLS